MYYLNFLIHRHGNHNYFKSTFMWYHTDVTGRILPTNPAIEEANNIENGNANLVANPANRSHTVYEQANLQNLAARAIIASRQGHLKIWTEHYTQYHFIRKDFLDHDFL